MTTPEIADQQFTIETYLTRSGRVTLPLDRRFAQHRVENNRPAPGPLAEFVRRGREPAFDQYLLLHAIASNNDEGYYDVRLPATAWARMIGGYFDPETGEVEPAALHLVSRNWRFLEALQLVDRQRVQRRARVWLRADDGSGDEYEHSGEGRRGKRLVDGEAGWIQLPYAYWYDRWHERLSLAAKAMLLIGITLGNGFQLPYAQVPTWYGISAATAERGLTQLHGHGLLHREQHRRPDTESPVGFVDVYYYELLPPFGPRDATAKSVHSGWVGPLAVPKPKRKRRPPGDSATRTKRRKAIRTETRRSS